jgi:Raf kinase inhibitor-like YbhB/YbcL family protein
MIVLALVMAACGTSGRNMQAPVPGATAPPRRADPTTSTLAGQATVSSAALFTLSSAAFSPGEGVPAEFSCDDVGNAPPVSWTNLPPGTVELALVIDDPDAAGFVHWLVAKIDPATTGLGPRVAPPGAIELHNSNGTAGYAPLCPPPGDTHVYDFTLYALDRPSGLTAQSDTTAALTTLATTAVGTAVLTGSYTRKTAN